MSDRTPQLGTIINEAIRRRLLEVRTGIPGRVEKVDLAAGMVDVKVLIKESLELDDGTVEPESVPVLRNVPLVISGGGGFRGTYPVAVGDVGELRFHHQSLDVWKTHGGEVEPVDLRRHDLSDAVFYSGLRDFAHPWTGVASDGATWGQDGGLQAKVTAAQLLLGLGAVDALLKGTSFLSAFNTWRTALNTYLAVLATLNPVNIAAAALVYSAAETAFAAALATVLSSKVLTE